jgi:uncharacterized membrane protein
LALSLAFHLLARLIFLGILIRLRRRRLQAPRYAGSVESTSFGGVLFARGGTGQGRFGRIKAIKIHMPGTGVPAMKRFGLFLVSSAITLATLPAIAQQSPGSDGTGATRFHHHMWVGHILGPFVMLLALIGIVALIMWLVRNFSLRAYHQWHGQGVDLHCPHCGHKRSRAALDILEDRFVRGEVGKDEFEEKRKLLGRQ